LLVSQKCSLLYIKLDFSHCVILPVLHFHYSGTPQQDTLSADVFHSHSLHIEVE